MELILGSSSPYRKALLTQLGLPFRCVSPNVDEAAVMATCRQQGQSPAEACAALGVAKARAVAQRHPDAVVIGSDQILQFGDDVLGKPLSADTAIAQLQRLRGRTHELVTACTVVTPGAEVTNVVVSRMTMRDLHDDEIRRYVAIDQPLDCAGSYKWESRGIALFERIETSDHTAIVGLPLLSLVTILRRLGFALP